ncbi:hypothetical protein CN204_24405 [Sinorhizobium meliloti]|nr:hypothetical protein CN204_24405 [Sinorhizobium meliloti]RVM23627.1 hypothetical protein CN132_22855 [Sinorhizobium meliloti]RVO03177.1 hypothetical protein CN102_23630 [Sinorhizobium meliloti]
MASKDITLNEMVLRLEEDRSGDCQEFCAPARYERGFEVLPAEARGLTQGLSLERIPRSRWQVTPTSGPHPTYNSLL